MNLKKVGQEVDNLDLSKAAYPLFANRTTRRSSLDHWDPTHCQKPDDLAELGFFYAGYADCARCFYFDRLFYSDYKINLPCGHVVFCQACGDLASICIFCKKVIYATAKIYYIVI